MRILIDMNLSPDFVPLLALHGHYAEHWSAVGRFDAPDEELAAYATTHDCVVLTNDQDFGAMLAKSRSNGPSVIQTRIPDVRPAALGPLLISVLNQFEAHSPRVPSLPS